MFRNTMRIAGACATLSCIAFASMPEARAHYDDAYYYDHRDLPSQRSWMASLHDATRLGQISMPGTHGSAARYGGWIGKNQTLTITQQLNAGIRFLDLRLRHVNGALELQHGIFWQRANFESALDEVAVFLRHNPSETVLVQVKEENTAPEFAGASFRASVNKRAGKYGRYFSKDVAWDSRLQDVRGKIVMVRAFHLHGGHSDFGGLDVSYELIVQDNYHLNTNWDLYAKWEAVKHLIHLANKSGPDPVPFVNFLSGSGGAFPYFVASGHSSPGTGDNGLSTGLVTPFFGHMYPDFPRGACFIGMCSIFFEGTNTLTKNYLINNKISYAGIIAADFPGAGLIQTVIDVNRVARPMSDLLVGQCLQATQSVLVSADCSGGDNQRLTVRGEQIRIGSDLCLDVDGGRNTAGSFIWASRSCNGSRASQRWKVEDSGRIRSLMPGAQHCLQSHFRALARLEKCHGGLAQIFRTRQNDMPLNAGIKPPPLYPNFDAGPVLRGGGSLIRAH